MKYEKGESAEEAETNPRIMVLVYHSVSDRDFLLFTPNSFIIPGAKTKNDTNFTVHFN